MFYSPLRYPGGKTKLSPFMELVIDKTGVRGGTYIEPFAGGAGIALNLLENDVVEDIVINDLDKGIYSFWKAILTEEDRFLKDIRTVPLNIKEWKKQHDICMRFNSKSSYELGFATFYMNRTNRSGIIKGGVIGGAKQDGQWKMDARFNRDRLCDKVEAIASKKKRIHVYNKDISSFIDHYLPKYSTKSLVYFDPPYYKKGRQLYLNFFERKDHEKIARQINGLERYNWIVTYDDTPEIEEIYNDNECRKFDLTYTASGRRDASEIMVFRSDDMIPTSREMIDKGINIRLRNAK